MKFKTYDVFLNESTDIKIDKELREFTLENIHDAVFQLKSGDFFKDFTVTPYKNEYRDKLRDIFNRLIDSIEDKNVNSLYAKIIDAESLDYKYGGIFNSKFSLKNIPEIQVDLSDNQEQELNTSEKKFLLNSYSGLSRRLKEDITKELIERAQILCCVIEALFSYIRATDKENFYNGMNTDEVIEEYEECIEKASKDENFSYEGPSNIPTSISPIKEQTEVAYWLCEKNLKKFVIFGTISIKRLHDEDLVNSTKGLNLSISKPDEKYKEDNYNFFELPELSKRVEMFYKENLK